MYSFTLSGVKCTCEVHNVIIQLLSSSKGCVIGLLVSFPTRCIYSMFH